MERTAPASDAVEIDVSALPVQETPLPAPPSLAPAEEGLTFRQALPLFRQHLRERRLADNTIKAFTNDLTILSGYFREETPVRNIVNEDLRLFLHWLEHGRGVACSKKSLARRIATLKRFFRWLHQAGLNAQDPARALQQVRVDPYMPSVLNNSEVRRLLDTASDQFWNYANPDERPLLLLSLLLQTGMKKQECGDLRLADFTAGPGQQFAVAISYPPGKHAYKSRVLPLAQSVKNYLDKYRAQYRLGDDGDTRLFACTPRNLEYILEDLGRTAGVASCKVGFEILRWTCAVNDFRRGMPDDALQRKLGLSKFSWRDTRAKIVALL